MAQTGTSSEESDKPTSSLKPIEGFAKDGTDSQGCQDPILPATTHSESGPSETKLAERSSERRQPARASKRDIVFVRKTDVYAYQLNTEPRPICSLPPISRAMARVTKSKVHLVQDAPQLARQVGSANGGPGEGVLREVKVSKGLPIVP